MGDFTPPLTKPCSSCKSIAPLESFGADSRSADGKKSRCKPCASADERSRRALRKVRNEGLSPREIRQATAEKKCSVCQQVRPSSAFYINSSSHDGLGYWCVGCTSAEYSENAETHRRRVRAYQKSNPEIFRRKDLRRAALKAEAFVEDVEMAVLLERDGSDCYLCRQPLDFDTPRAIHIEHRTPISRGGEHSYANVALACMKCNVRKRHRTEEEFRALLT